ncbi:MAG: hypothetical protein IJL26_00100 [Clostridia bacterium]|nr:hypothetical protein [Clostridia bacterium]
MKHYHGAFTQYRAKIYDGEDARSARCAAALPDGSFLAAGGGKLYRFTENVLLPLSDIPDPARSVSVRDGKVLLCAGNSVFEDVLGTRRETVFDEPVLDAAPTDDGLLWVLTEKALYRVQDGEAENTNDAPPGAKQIDARRGEKVFCACRCGLFAKKGKRRHWAELTSEWSGLASDDTRCVRLDGLGFIWTGTAKGVCVWDDGNEWRTPENTSNLPAAPVNDMYFAADGAKYFACDTGIIILKNGKLRYLTYRRWLPSPKVRTLAVNDNGDILALTDAGASLITAVTMTPEQKADYFDALTEKYFLREDGWCVSRRLTKPGDLDSGFLRATDNDGLYTGLYAAAQSFRYAVTGDETAKKRARRAVDALIKLTQITGIPGFPARAIRYAHEPDFGTGDRREWHFTDETKQVEWRGETSSDEITGHLYGFAVYYDLCADDGEKTRVAAAVRAIVDHIIGHGWHLVDTDGAPTTWGNWAPESINGDGKWIFEHGINSLEILSYLLTAYHVSGDEKYKTAFLTLAREHHYLLNVMNYKTRDAHVCHIDDQLGFNAVYALLEYVSEPDIRSIVQMGLADHREYERAERTPLYEFVYARFTGDCGGVSDAARTLAEMPLDLANWPVWNSHIPGLEWDREPEKYGNPPHLAEPLSREIAPICGGAGNPMFCDAGSDEFILKAESNGLFDKVSLAWHNGLSAQNPLIYL